MRYTNSEKKLKHARKLFEDTLDWHEQAHAEAHRASRFYHNSECEGQWEREDLEYLRKNERMALTFNILKTKIDTFLGMYSDAQRTPIIASADSDTLGAEVLDAVKTQLLQDANYEALAARQLKTGAIEGECSLHLEVVPSGEGQDWIQLNLYRLLPYEVLWDYSSIEPDRNDARYVFWYRWLDKEEFENAYPDHADEWAEFAAEEDDSNPFAWGFGEKNSGDPESRSSDYEAQRTNRYYFDKRNRLIRVIRYEYKHSEEKTFAIDLESGEKIDATEKKVMDRVKMATALGQQFQVIKQMVDSVEVCEFVGNTLLAEYTEAGPFDGFSIVPFSYEVDEETGTSYGMCRNLFDPQMELNKARSLDLELTAQATTPGTIAEIGAIPDKKRFEAEKRRPNGIAEVAKGALSEGAPKIIERQATQPSAIAAQRSDAAMRLLDEVSGIPSASNLTAAEHAQAGVTVAIRYHKSRQTVSTPFSHYERAQKALVEKVVDVIVNVMPDDQIMEIVGRREDLQVQDGRIIEMVPAPAQAPDQGSAMMQQEQQPQMMPKRMADITNLRKLKWRLDLEYASENSTLRMLELEIMLNMAQVAGVPVDPEVLVEMATSSRSIRERLKKYIEKAKVAAAAGQKAEADALVAQSQGVLQIEAAKVQETTRHNTVQEKIDLLEAQLKLIIEQMKLGQQAEDAEQTRLHASDEADKDRQTDIVKTAAEMRMSREQAQAKQKSGGANGR